MSETEQIAQALQRYFDNADPSNDEFNSRLIQNDLRLHGGKLLLFAPVMIKSHLRNALVDQIQQRYSLGITDDEMDNQLKKFGLILLMEYASLFKAAGSEDIFALTLQLPMMKKIDEDRLTITAYTLATLARSDSLLMDSAINKLKPMLLDFFNQAYNAAHNTSCKFALSYALFQCGQSEPFKSFAMQQFAHLEGRRTLERMLACGDPNLQVVVAFDLIMDIASNGSASPNGWQRRRD